MSVRELWDVNEFTFNSEAVINSLSVDEAETFRRNIYLQYTLENREMTPETRSELNRIVWLARKRRTEECIAETERMHQHHVSMMQMHQPYVI
jgi:hypothetical protein